jgi:hypothetical protein
MTPHADEVKSTFAAQFDAKDRSEAVREAYRKHAGELLAIEEAQQKLVLLVLAVFGAVESFLGGAHGYGPRIGITVMVVSILVVAGVYTGKRNRARESVRKLMVNCERALGFYEDDRYIKGESLYPQGHQHFPDAGEWLGWIYWFAVLAGVGLLVVLWSLPR